MFDNLNSGQGYRDVKPVVQVCFLDFTLFKEAPEFFSTYMFLNVNNYMIYSDKLKLHVVDLTQIEKATREDYYNERQYIENKMRELEREKQELEQRLMQERQEQLRELEWIKQELTKSNADKDEQIARLQKELSGLRKN